MATILSIELQEAINLIGHKKGTTTKEIVKHFKADKLKIGFPDKYSLCKSWPSNRKVNSWHWIIYKDGKIYDPCLGYMVNANDYLITFNIKITSFIGINI